MCLFPHINVVEEKQTETMDESKVLTFDTLKPELFYPSRVENQDTSPHVIKMAVELEKFFLVELRDPKKTTSNYPKIADINFIWGQTTDE